MNTKINIKYLLLVLFVIGLGFFLLHAGFQDRNIPSVLQSTNGPLDISDYFSSFYPNAFYAVFFVAVFLLAHLYLRLKLPYADPYILPVVALLSGIGVIMMLRLAPDLAMIRSSVVSNYHAGIVKDNVLTLAQLGMKQFTHVVAGVLVLVIVAGVLNARLFSMLSSLKYIWVVISVCLIAVTMIYGDKINNRRLWLFGFQTVEFVKLLVILFISGYIYEKGQGLNLYNRRSFIQWMRFAGPYMMMWVFAIASILIMKDIGPSLVIFIVFLFMLHYAGNRKIITLIIVVSIFVIGAFSYASGVPPIVRERFDALFYPFQHSESMSRVLWSISSGGVYGAGLGYGEPQMITEVQSDFNFAAICEELGFLGGLSIILVIALFVFRCFKISLHAKDEYKKALVVGIAVLVTVQTFIIIAGNLVFIPLTGITLPFVSYGGSSMIANFLMAGIVLRISGEK